MKMPESPTERELLQIEEREGDPPRLPTTMWTHFKRIDGPWSWIMCVLLLTSILLQYGCACTYGIFFPNILKEFQSGRAITAIPGSLANTSVLGIITGKLCDLFGSHRIMVIGGLISATGMIASSFVPNIEVLILTYGVVLSFGASCVYSCGMLGVQMYFQKFKFEATSTVYAGASSALLVMSPIAQQLNKALGWRKSMLYMASFSIVPCVVGLLMRSKPVENEDAVTTDCDENHSTSQSYSVSNLLYCSVFKIKIFSLVTVMVTVACLGHSMPFIHLAKFCDDIGISSDLSSWLYFTIGLTSTISRCLVGKFGKSVPLSLPQIFQVGCFIHVVGNLYLPSVSKYYALVLYCIGYGFGEGLLLTPCVLMVMECLPSNRKGSGFGIVNCFISSSYVVGSIFSGVIADVSGSYNYAFYIAASLEIVGGSLGFLARFISPPDKHEELDTELVVIEKETVL